VNPRGKTVATEVEAQIAGSVWKIEKSVGDSVDEEEVILIIESMKMEIPVEAPCSGRLSELRVVEGDAIEEGAILAVIE
jgi:acetyl-CoA carboxylase biotin carboxyl carrier protein